MKLPHNDCKEPKLPSTLCQLLVYTAYRFSQLSSFSPWDLDKHDHHPPLKLPVFNGHVELSRYALSRVRSLPHLYPCRRHAIPFSLIEGFLRHGDHLRDNILLIMRHSSVLVTLDLQSTFSLETYLSPHKHRRMNIMIENLEFPPQICAIHVYCKPPSQGERFQCFSLRECIRSHRGGPP